MRVFGFIKFLAPLLVLLLGYQMAWALTTVTVTEKGDIGPGTLRAALQYISGQNGLGAPYQINFNIPGTTTADHTILLQSSLPELSSFLTIDGTTQPGDAFPIGDAKIKIILPAGNLILACLQGTKKTDIAIYGLYIDKQVPLLGDRNAGILFINSKNIKIGAPGKGNFISNVRNAIEVTYEFQQPGDFDDLSLQSENVEIKSNIIGLSENGTMKSELGSSFIFCRRVKNLTIGGSSANDGNIVMGSVYYEEGQDDFKLSTGKLMISWNQIGLNYAGASAILPIPYTEVQFTAIDLNSRHLTDCELTNNTIAGSFTGMRLVNVNCFFKITSNKLGTDISGLTTIGFAKSAIELNSCTGGGIIGGQTSADQNVIQGASVAYKDYGVIDNTNSPSVEVTRNVFKCNYNSYSYAVKSLATITNVAITDRTPASISGTAKPNSEIQLYYSASSGCTSCEPEQFFNSIPVDNAGNWKYLGNSQDKNIIVSARFAGQTSEFTSIRADFTPSDVKIQMVCGTQKGSISGLKYKNASFFTWYKDNAPYKTTNDISDLDPGIYYLEVSDGLCTIKTDQYTITDETLKLNQPTIQPTRCSASEGSITGIIANPDVKFQWRKGSSTGPVLPVTIPDLIGYPSGNYTLIISNAYCSQPYTFTIPVVDDPLVDTYNKKITNTTCDNTDGSITGITITGSGPYTFIWRNQQQQRVNANTPNSIDLVNVASGKYTLEISGGNICTPIVTPEFEILRNGTLTLIEDRVLASPACNGNSGSISGMLVTGATAYTWRDQADNIIPSNNGPDLRNAPPGTYKLQASNSFCMKESKYYTILGPLAADVSLAVPVPDQCSSGKGSIISNIQVSGGLAPYSYTWKDAAGKTVGTKADLTNVKAGTYSLQITDVYGGTCSALDYEFMVPDQTTQLTSPYIPDVTVCAPGEAVILVDSPLPGTYSLFDDASAATPIAVSSNGVFILQVAAEKEYYISFTSGSCSSAKVPFNVFVSDEGFKVSGSFTPNGDGINDTWRIFNIENYPRADIRLYNRTGQRVFQTIGYSTPFDGKRNGSNLPEGSYYYVIDLRSGCKTLSGSLTIIR